MFLRRELYVLLIYPRLFQYFLKSGYNTETLFLGHTVIHNLNYDEEHNVVPKNYKKSIIS